MPQGLQGSETNNHRKDGSHSGVMTLDKESSQAQEPEAGASDDGMAQAMSKSDYLQSLNDTDRTLTNYYSFNDSILDDLNSEQVSSCAR